MSPAAAAAAVAAAAAAAAACYFLMLVYSCSPCTLSCGRAPPLLLQLLMFWTAHVTAAMLASSNPLTIWYRASAAVVSLLPELLPPVLLLFVLLPSILLPALSDAY
jgi:hypothetical protein